MPYTIAVAGKGGTGKTTLSALIIRNLLKAGRTPVLAVDADPSSNLHEALGMQCDRTVISTVDAIMEKKEELPAGLTKERYLELHFQDALVESRGLDLLVMGHGEGPGCYCHANNLLRNLLDTLQGNYPYVVMDNEAGMEHLSRRTTRSGDVLLVVSNPTPVSLRAARKIFAMSKELKLDIKDSYLVVNDTRRYPEAMPAEIEGLPLLARIPYDAELEKCSIEGRSVVGLDADSPAVLAVQGMMEKLGRG